MKLISLAVVLGAVSASTLSPIETWVDMNVTDMSECEEPSCKLVNPELIMDLLGRGHYFLPESADKVLMMDPDTKSYPYTERWMTRPREAGLPCTSQDCYAFRYEDDKSLYSEYMTHHYESMTVTPDPFLRKVAVNRIADGLKNFTSRDEL